MGQGFVNVSGGGGSEEKLTAHLGDKNNPHGVTAEQVGAMPLVPVQINDTDNVLNLAPGRYWYEGSSDKQTTEMHLPCLAWHWEITVMATAHAEGTTGNYKIILAVDNSGGVYWNVLAWESWSGWNKIATVGDLANYLPLSGGTMTGALCVGKHARLSEAAGDSWGAFALDAVYGDGFARLALICYGAGSDPGAIVQVFKENGELVKEMSLIHDGNIGNYALPMHGWQQATDFDTLTASGIYQCQGVNLNTPYGSSGDTHFYIVVLRNSDPYIRQIAYDVRGQNCYTRVKVNGAWYAWQQIVLGSDLAAKQDASTAINTGNIGSQNVNYATYAAIGNYDQDYGARLRNQALVASDTTPPSNGQIYWTYG